MNPFETELFKKGYVKLQHGSYYVWISKRWHEMFVRRGLVKKNFYGQYCCVKENFSEYDKWCVLYEKTCHDRDFPKSYKQLTEGDTLEIRQYVY